MVGRSMWDVFPDAGSEFREACLRAWREGKPVTVERFSTVLGVWVESYIYPFENGASVQWRDITERKRVEGALRTTEHRDRSLFENSLDAAILTLGNGRIQAANPAACALFGMTEQEIRERGRAGLADESDPRLQQVLRERRRTGRARGEFTFIRKDGTRFMGDVSSVTVGAQGLAFVNIRDVTERGRVEQELRDSERHFHELADSMPELVWISEANGDLTYVNRRACEEMGVSPNALLGERWTALLHPEDRERRLSHWHRCLETGENASVEYRLRVASGEYRWFLGRAVPFRDELGRITRWYGTTTDIEDSKRSEEALRDSERHFRELADSMPQMVFVANANGSQLYANPQSYEQLGVGPNGFSGERWAELLHPEDRERALSYWHRCVETGEHYEDEQRVRVATGEYRRFLVRAVPFRDDRGILRAGTEPQPTSRTASAQRNACGTRNNWKASACSLAALRTTSTTSWSVLWATPA